MRNQTLWLVLAGLTVPTLVSAGEFEAPPEFRAGDPIVAEEFNAILLALEEAINNNDDRIAMLESLPTQTGGTGDLPPGAIAFFDAAQCPSGWSLVSDLEGRVIVGASAGSSGSMVGDALANEAMRTISDVPMHSHTVDAPASATMSGGTHDHLVDPPATVTSLSGGHSHQVNPPPTTTTPDTHSHNVDYVTGSYQGQFNGNLIDWPVPSGGGSGTLPTSSYTHVHTVDIPNFNSGNNGAHTHSVNIAAFASGTVGNHSHNLDLPPFASADTGVASVDVTMPYLQLLACSKD